MAFRDRIKELRRVPASEITANPKNWRTHPLGQQNALKGILAEVGIADAMIAYEDCQGRLVLIDGHLRTATMPNEIVPVLVLDVNEAEADKLLAVIDPLAAMAGTNSDKLDGLLREIQTGDDDLAKLLSKLAQDSGIVPRDTPAVNNADIGEPSDSGDDRYAQDPGDLEPIVSGDGEASGGVTQTYCTIGRLRVPVDPAEMQRFEAAYAEHVEEVGMPAGFIAAMLDRWEAGGE